MKISICITTFNEEKTIAPLLDSLMDQTKKADEIVIVDGGSGDKTAQIIGHYQKKLPIKLLVEKGGIAHGRNTAIDLAKNEIIIQIDGGCIAKSDWLEKITEPFRHEEIDFVAGFYEMTGEAPLQKAVSLYQGIPPERYRVTTFLAAGRSMAFRKKVWEEVGGYRENLDRGGDDTAFNYQITNHKFQIARVKDAIVYWEAPKSLKEAANKFYLHARGDAQAGIWWNPGQGVASHNLKIVSIFLRYLFFLGLLFAAILGRVPYTLFTLIFTAYLIWSVWKWRDVKRGFLVKAWIPILQIVSDFSVMAGFITGSVGK